MQPGVRTSMTATPKAPLWETNPTRPRAAPARANVAFSPTAGSVLTTPRQLADEPHAGRPADLQQLPLPRSALGARLPEAGRDHHDRADALGHAVARGAGDRVGRHGDDREVRGQLADRGRAPLREPRNSARGLTG